MLLMEREVLLLEHTDLEDIRNFCQESQLQNCNSLVSACKASLEDIPIYMN